MDDGRLETVGEPNRQRQRMKDFGHLRRLRSPRLVQIDDQPGQVAAVHVLVLQARRVAGQVEVPQLHDALVPALARYTVQQFHFFAQRLHRRRVRAELQRHGRRRAAAPCGPLSRPRQSRRRRAGPVRSGPYPERPGCLVRTAACRSGRNRRRSSALRSTNPAGTVRPVGSSGRRMEARMRPGIWLRKLRACRRTSSLFVRSTRRFSTQPKMIVRRPSTSTRRCRCSRTARASTCRSRSRPLRTRSSTLSRCVTRVTSCSMIGPSSRSAVA